MPNSFSTFFEGKLGASVVNSVTYTLIVGSLDCTDELQALPRIKRETDKIVAENTTIRFVRSDALVNSLGVQSFSWFHQPVAFSWGFVTASGTDDTIQLLSGRVKDMTIAKDAIEMGVVDKNDAFSRIFVGSIDNPSDGSIAAPSEAWWDLMTMEGGLNSLKSVSNPDIDYNAWQTWSDFDASEAADLRVLVMRMSEKSNVLDLQQKVVKLASAAVFQDGAGRLVPVSWNKRIVAGSMEIGDSDIIGDIETIFKNNQILNRVRIGAYWTDSVVRYTSRQSSSSINSWGLYDDKIYYEDMRMYEHDWVSSGVTYNNGASLAAYRMITVADDPDELVRHKIKTNISGMKYLPEDAVALVTSRDLLGSRNLTIRKVEYDLDKGLVNIELMGRCILP